MSRFRPPSISQPNHFLIGVASPQSSDGITPPKSYNVISQTTPISPGPNDIIYAGPPTPSFARRKSQSQFSPGPSVSPSPSSDSMTPTSSSSLSSPPPMARPSSASVSKPPPPRRAPPQRPSQVAADGNAPPTPITNSIAPSPMATETMSMEELNALLGVATTPAADATVPAAAAVTTVKTNVNSIKCDSDPTHTANVHCSDCDESLCFDCDTLIHNRKKFSHHLRSAIDQALIDSLAAKKAATTNGSNRTPAKLAHTALSPSSSSSPSPSNTSNDYVQLQSPSSNTIASPSPSSSPSLSIDPTNQAPDILYRGPATPSFARKQSILASKGTNLLSPNSTQSSPSPSPSPSPSTSPSPSVTLSSPLTVSVISPTPVTFTTINSPPVVGELPPGWVEYVDKSSGKSYYHNVTTKVTVWDRPVAAAASPPSTTASGPSSVSSSISSSPVMDAGELAAQRQRELDERLKREHDERRAAEARHKAEEDAKAAAAASAAAEAQRLEEERLRVEQEQERARLQAVTAAEEERERERLRAIAAAEEARVRAAAEEAARLQAEQLAAAQATALALEQARLAAETERLRLAAVAEQERLERERLAKEAEELRIAQAEALRLKQESEAELARLAAAAEADRIRLELSRETERLREERARLLADTERLKLEQAQHEAERARQEKERAEEEKLKLQAKLAAMEKRLEEEAAERAKKEIEARLQAEAVAAAAAAIEEERRRRRIAEEESSKAAAAQLEAEAAERAKMEEEKKLAAATEATVTSSQSTSPVAIPSMDALPPDWVEYTDQSSGRPYYYNKATKLTSWDRPLHTPAPPPGSNSTPTTSPSVSHSKPVLKPNLQRVSIILASGAEFKPPPPRRGSVSMIAPNFPNANGPGPARGSLSRPASLPVTSTTTVRESVTVPAPIQAKNDANATNPNQNGHTVSLNGDSSDDDDDGDDLPSDPPPKPSPAAIAARRASMALGQTSNGVTNTATNGQATTKSNADATPLSATPTPTSQSTSSAQTPVPSNPDEWRAVVDVNGQKYWYNRRSRETSWVDPTIATSSISSTSGGKRLDPNWREYRDPTGKPYYYNRQTSETLWEKPHNFELSDEDDEPNGKEETNGVQPTSSTNPSSESAPRLHGRPQSLSDISVNSDLDSDDDPLDTDDDDVAELAALGMSIGDGVNTSKSSSSVTTTTVGPVKLPPHHPRTVSDTSGMTRSTVNTTTTESNGPTHHRAVSASVALSSPTSASAAKSQIRKCTLSECVSFSVRDGYCLRHQWRNGFDMTGGLLKEAMGQYVAAKEILTTEKSYLEQLRTIQKAFFHRLQTSIVLCFEAHRPPIISEEDLYKVFINHNELLAISEALYADLAELHYHDRLVEFVSTTLLHYIPRFTVYSEYLERFDESRKRLTRLKETNPDFAQFVKVTEKIEGLSLESFLVTPVQRLPRYLLLLKELARRLTGDDPVTKQILADCNQAHDDLAKMTTSLNSSLNTAENLAQLKNLSRLFVRNNSRFQSFLKPNRKLLKQGVLRKKFSNKSYNLQSYKSYYFFLTNDLIFYAVGATTQQSEMTDHTSGQSHIAMNAAMNNAQADETTVPIYKMKHMYRLEDMYVDKSDPKITAKSAKKAPNPLKFYMWNEDGRVIGLQAANETEREQWFQAIDSAIAAAKKAAK